LSSRKAKPLAQININVPDELKERVDQAAKEDMRTLKAVLILGLEAYLKDRKQASLGSATIGSSAPKYGTPDGAE